MEEKVFLEQLRRSWDVEVEFPRRENIMSSCAKVSWQNFSVWALMEASSF